MTAGDSKRKGRRRPSFRLQAVALLLLVVLGGKTKDCLAFVILPLTQCGKHPRSAAATTTALRLSSSSPYSSPRKRLERAADTTPSIDEDCILTIHGVRYDVSAWAKAHPGGVGVLKRYHNRDASEAFDDAAHSGTAHDMLKEFIVDDAHGGSNNSKQDAAWKQRDVNQNQMANAPSYWKSKLFTKEDPIGLHKYAGVFVLLHFSWRYIQMYFGDFSCGLGSRGGKGPSVIAALCLVPHAMLSLSSLIFHTVPRERVVGKPMIWQEFRLHNIAFGMRSVLTTFLAWLSIYKQHAHPWRRIAVVGSCAVTLLAMMIADEGTNRLRANDEESTTATMPYWEGCSMQTQKKFKLFYAFSQFQATATCMAVGNPAWTLSILLPIQLASFLMTLVRKNIISPRGYHIAYSISLAMPYFVGLRSMLYMKNLDFPLFLAASWLLFQLRRRGSNKYLVWTPFVVARILFGDLLLQYERPW